jgi:hypothetical protein
LSEYDDGKDLTSYDFEADCFSSPYDDLNKRKLAYRHRAIGEKYAKVSQDLPYLALFPLKVFLSTSWYNFILLFCPLTIYILLHSYLIWNILVYDN